MSAMNLPVSLLSSEGNLFERVEPVLRDATAGHPGAEFAALVDHQNPNAGTITVRADNVDDLKQIHQVLQKEIGGEGEGMAGVNVQGDPSFLVPES
jgi:hypothetical protein